MYQRLLVPVDGSPPSDAALTEAIRLARLTGGQIRLLHVVDNLPFVFGAEGYGGMSTDVIALLREAGEKILQQARARVVEAGIAVDTVLGDSPGGRLCDAVVAQVGAWAADLVVIGTHGRRGASRVLLGSDAEQVVRHAGIPVLVVRRPEAPAA
ncbi:universal stress protein [Aquincola sp. MAHUQ-54]|uniref:Universal stress protein n=1 Tax=Aquincola agrisoli TaxID=3119538 RepID=A0AAW9QBQ1_9BURK